MNIENKIKIILNNFKARNYKLVIEETIRLSRFNPENSFLKNLLGSAYLNINEIEKAIESFKFSIKLFPNNVAAINNLANAYKKIFKYKDSKQNYLKALELQPDYFNAIMNFGNLNMLINNVNKAIKLYDRAAVLNPKNHLIYFNLATAHQSVGNFLDAKINAEKCLKINPHFSPADKLLSNYLIYDKKNEHFLDLKNKIKDNEITQENKTYLHFAIAKAYEDIGSFKESFEHIKKGNFSKNTTLDYNIDIDIGLINQIKSSFKGFDYKKNYLKDSDKKIIFVVGMPRSGTSLIEQIISSHSLVFAAGEIPFLRKSIFDNLKKNQEKLSSVLSKYSNFESIANNFEEMLAIFPSGEKNILDKSLLNFLWIGFIKILYPKSKIIHVKRGPKDCCFSCYKNLFENGLQFTYDQTNLGNYYNAYSDLMNFWNKELNNFILDINYEELVEQPEDNIKKLLNFCELEYEQNCFEHQNNKSPIRTMSAVQARTKIYKSSINLYKNYETFLEELFNILDKKKAL